MEVVARGGTPRENSSGRDERSPGHAEAEIAGADVEHLDLYELRADEHVGAVA